MDSSIAMGITYQRGITTTLIKIKQTIRLEMVFFFMYLKIKLYTGENINAKIIPKSIDIIKGFIKKNAKISKETNIMLVIIFLV